MFDYVILLPSKSWSDFYMSNLHCKDVQNKQIVKKISGRRFGISSIVLGIIGLFFSFRFAYLPMISHLIGTMYDYAYPIYTDRFFIAIFTFIQLSILSIIFAIIAKKRNFKNITSTVGLISGILGFVGYIAETVHIFMFLYS